MPKTFILYSFLFLFLVQTLHREVIWAIFKLNQAQITAEHCENKDKPEMQCNGHCYLNKQIKQEEKSESSQIPSPKIEETTLIDVVAPFTTHFFIPERKERFIHIPYSLHELSKGFLRETFQPPDTKIA